MPARRNSDGAEGGSEQQAAAPEMLPTDAEMLSRFETLEQQVAQMPQVVAAAVSAAMRQHSQQATVHASNAEPRRVQFAEQQAVPQHAAAPRPPLQPATQLFADGDDELLAELAATGLASATTADGGFYSGHPLPLPPAPHSPHRVEEAFAHLTVHADPAEIGSPRGGKLVAALLKGSHTAGAYEAMSLHTAMRGLFDLHCALQQRAASLAQWIDEREVGPGSQPVPDELLDTVRLLRESTVQSASLYQHLGDRRALLRCLASGDIERRISTERRIYGAASAILGDESAIEAAVGQSYDQRAEASLASQAARLAAAAARPASSRTRTPGKGGGQRQQQQQQQAAPDLSQFESAITRALQSAVSRAAGGGGGRGGGATGGTARGGAKGGSASASGGSSRGGGGGRGRGTQRTASPTGASADADGTG